MAEQIIIPGVGDIIADKYAIQTELGRGAYGVVFGCEQVDIGRYVAVKTLLPQAFLKGEVVKRFHREAQLISRLDHPNVIRLFDYGVDDGLLYMAVEFVSGETLSDLMKRGPLAPNAIIQISLQILAGLEHAHENGIVHRDLKPDNVIVIERESGFEAKILDFGISKLIAGDESDRGAMNTLTQDGSVLGTPHYMSPENIVGDDVDHRADIYALGIMMYEMAAGKHPFDAPSPSAVFVRHLRDDAPLLEDEIQNSSLGSTIFGAIEKQPDDRIQSAAKMRELLVSDTFEPVVRKKIEDNGFTEIPSRKRVLLFGVFMGALVVALLLVLFLFIMGKENTREIAQKQDNMAFVNPDSQTNAGFNFSDEELIDLPNPAMVEGIVVSKTLLAQSIQRAVVSSQQEASINKKGKKRNAKSTSLAHKGTNNTTLSKNEAVKVFFVSVPSNAIVKINNTRIGTTPTSRVFKDPSIAMNVSFSQLGYHTSRLRFTPAQNERVNVKLKPKRLGID